MTSLFHVWASLVVQLVKNLPVMQETRVWSLGWEDPLEKEMATHSSTLAWRIPWTEEPGRPQSMGSQSQTLLCDYVHAHVHAWKEIFMFIGNLVSYKACHMAQPGKSSIENLFAQVKWPDSVFAEEIVVVQSLTCVRLFATPCTAVCQASLSFTISWSLLRLMSIELMIPSNHLIFCCPLLLLPSIFPSIRVFTNELTLHIRWPKYWSFNFSISPSNEYSGWFPLRLTDLISLLAKELSRVFFSNTVGKCQFFGTGPIWFHLAWHLSHNPFPIFLFINSDNTCLLNTYYVKGSVLRAGCMQCGGIVWPATVHMVAKSWT